MSHVVATYTSPWATQQAAQALAAQKQLAQDKATTDAAPASGAGSFAAQLYQADSAAVSSKPLPLVRAPEQPAPVSQAKSVPQQNALGNKAEGKASTYQGAAVEEKDIRAQMNDVPASEDEFGFWDFVDLVNPLHHIPIVGTIYRELTGDTIKPEIQVAGGVLLGVATGSILLSAATSIASAALEQSSGKEPTVMVANALFGDHDKVQLPDPINEPKIVVADASHEILAQEDIAPPPQAAPQAEVTSQLAQAVAAIKEQGPAATKEQTQIASSALSPAATSSFAQAPLAAQTAQTGSVRMGNVIYTSPLMNNAARVRAPQRSAEATPVSSAATKTSMTSEASEAEATPQSKAQSNALPQMMQQQAQVKATGNTLPPQLIEDMMLKALDKYHMAHKMGATDIYVD